VGVDHPESRRLRYIMLGVRRLIRRPAVPLYLLSVSGLGLMPALAPGQVDYTPYTFTTMAGEAHAVGSADGAGSTARFNSPAEVAVDSVGNLYVADTGNSTIRKVSPVGAVTTLAGLAGVTGSADGIGSAARFDHPQGVAVDSVGNLYVGDTDNRTIRRIARDGTVTTFAGQAGTSGGMDGAGSVARFSYPLSVAVAQSGIVYVADRGNYTIRKITPDGVVSTLATSGAATSGLRNPGDGPESVAVDAAGNVYAADYVHWIGGLMKIAPNSVVTTPAIFTGSFVLAVDMSGNIYEANQIAPWERLKRITPGGVVSTLTGDGADSVDGTSSVIPFVDPGGIAVDAVGNIYVTERGNNTIRKGRPDAVAPTVMNQPVDQTITAGWNAVYSVTAEYSLPSTHQWQWKAGGSTTWTDLNNDATFSGTTAATLTVTAVTEAMNGGSFRCVIANAIGSAISAPAGLAVVVSPPLTVSTLAGKAGVFGSDDGTGGSARFSAPTDLAVDHIGNIYVADTNNHTIRKITPAGVVTTLAGLAGFSGSLDGKGTAAQFHSPAGVAIDASDNVYVADTDNNAIRKIAPTGMVTTLAGTGRGSSDATGTAAGFLNPSGIVTDTAGILYVADTLNGTIRRITPDGVVTTLAGQAGSLGNADGVGSAARFDGPQGLALDGAGNLYVADSDNLAIRKLTLSSGAVTKVAGGGRAIPGFAPNDGPVARAQFNYPCGVAVDGAGNLYVADTDNHTIRQITPAGIVTTIAGLSGTYGSADGVGAAARFNYPAGIAVDAAGDLYIADTDNHTIRLAYFAAGPAITAQPQSQTVTVGSNVQFSVTTSGRPAATYQWYFNGVTISGATNSSLSLSNVQTSNAGSYTVAVSNPSGNATSTAATLTVNPPVPAAASSASSGGGALEEWFVGLLALFALARVGARKGTDRPLTQGQFS
jgi:sugar lactone lactonase YvrE